jgi:hypothetical protein
LTAELGHLPSASELLRIEQIISLTLQREAAEAAVSRGAPADLGSILKLSGLLERALAALFGKPGKRTADRGGNLQAYLAAKASGAAP